MKPKYITFLQCTLDDNWRTDPIDQLTNGKLYLTDKMSRLQSITDDVRVFILDMSYKEVKLYFKKLSVIGIGNGMFYCDAQDVSNTSITDAPPEL